MRAHLALKFKIHKLLAVIIIVHGLFFNIVFIILQIKVIFIDNLIIVIVLLGWNELLLVIELLELHVLLLHFEEMLVFFS